MTRKERLRRKREHMQRYAQRPRVKRLRKRYLALYYKRPEVRGRRNAAARERYKDPEKRKAIKRAQKKYLARPGVKERQRARHRAYYHTEGIHKVRARAGIPPAQRPKPAKCDCCRQKAKLVLDHCHVSGVFRGWLCNKCNLGLGLFNDSVKVFRRAIKYLERNT